MISMRGVTACQEMERGKRERERERELPGLFGPGLEERAEFQAWLGRDWGFLCALFRAEVLTEGPWPPLSRNSLTLSPGAQRAHMLQRCAAGVWGARVVSRVGSPRDGQKEPTHTTPSGSGMFAQGNWVSVPELNEPLQRPQGGPKAA